MIRNRPGSMGLRSSQGSEPRDDEDSKIGRGLLSILAAARLKSMGIGLKRRKTVSLAKR